MEWDGEEERRKKKSFSFLGIINTLTTATITSCSGASKVYLFSCF